jgi:hypothetical protein
MAKGLLVAGFDYSGVDAGEFNDWYDTEHVPERHRTPGFINGVRWVGVENDKVSIATYDLQSREVLYSEPYKAIARDNLSPWSKRVIAKAQRLLRIEADQLIPGDEISRLTTQHLMVFACNVKPEMQAEVKQWYGDEHIPRLRKVPGVVSARFFESQASTHKFIALYEIETAEICTMCCVWCCGVINAARRKNYGETLSP